MQILTVLFVLVSLTAGSAQPKLQPTVNLIKKKFLKSSYTKICQDFPSFSDNSRFRMLPLKPAQNTSKSNGKYLLEFQCNSGAYNASFLYFLFDSKKSAKKKTLPMPSIILFPHDIELLNIKDHKERWQLKKHQAQVFTRYFDTNTLELTAFRKGIGDGSIGYYSKYKIDSETGLPRLLISFSRIEEDHQAGYNFTPESQPSGEGWLSWEPQKPLTGVLKNFK